MADDTDRDQDIGFEEVFETELDCVRARWDAVYQGERQSERQVERHSAEGDTAAPTLPSTEHGLVGIGLSGGGIRSATFNLGVIQSLVRRGVFDHVDYMSTVSGGGYLGSAISAAMARPGADFPYPYISGPSEHPGVTWLRNHSNYMVSKGALDWLRIGAVLVRGILLNVLVIAPLLFAAALLVAWVRGDELRSWHVQGIDLSDCYRYTRWMVIAVVLYFLAFGPATRLLKLLSMRGEVGTGPANSLVVRDRHELSYAWLVLALVVVAAFESLPVLLHGYHRLLESPIERDLISGLGAIASVAAGVVAKAQSTMARSLLRTVLLQLLGLVGLILPLLVMLLVAETLVHARGPLHDLGHSLGVDSAVVVVGLMVAIWLFCRLFIDINETSVHGLYRDRLAAAYRVGVHEPAVDPGDVHDVRRDIPLSRLCARGSTAPYQLVNVALNLQGSDDENIRERLASHFILSKEYVGGQQTGYAPTRDLEEVHPRMSLAMAMAISAAAASPNMGSYTIASLRALMVLLNVRLGYWLPNPATLTPWAARKGRPWSDPARTQPGRPWRRLRWDVPPRMLIAEMFGRLHERGHFVNLSDGGHLENLGTIELLRRRMKYIIIGDAEADPKHEFRGLAVLIRQARLDLGIEIRIQLAELSLGDTGESHTHCAFGRIVYPARTPDEKPEDGMLVYIKLSMTGDEDQTIRQYRAENPAFPHQSTGDQFFDEGQFEAYRALGFHAAEQLFDPIAADAGRQVMPYHDLDAWFMQHLRRTGLGDWDPADDSELDPTMLPNGPLSFDTRGS